MSIFNWLFSHNKDIINGDVEKKSAQIQDIKDQIEKQTAKTTERLEKVNELLERTITEDLARISGG
jgi:ferritin